MTLLEDARTTPARRPGPRCAVSRLAPDLRAQLDEALASDVDLPRVQAALRKRGVDIGVEVLKRHRRGECMSCRT